jgi:hypothetical protein
VRVHWRIEDLAVVLDGPSLLHVLHRDEARVSLLIPHSCCTHHTVLITLYSSHCTHHTVPITLYSHCTPTVLPLYPHCRHVYSPSPVLVLR